MHHPVGDRKFSDQFSIRWGEISSHPNQPDVAILLPQNPERAQHGRNILVAEVVTHADNHLRSAGMFNSRRFEAIGPPSDARKIADTPG